jgi:hypothetical protein
MLADQLAIALQPLHSAFESAGALRDFLEELGWDFDVAPTAIDRLRTPVEQVFAILNDPDGVDASDVPRLLTSVRAVLDAVSGLASDAELAADFKNEFPRQLVDYLVVDYLLYNQPRVGYLLMGLGILSVEDRPEAGTRPPYVFRGFAWERLPDVLHDPKSHLTSVYRWGQSNFDSARLIDSLAGFLEAWHQQVSTDAVDESTAANLNKNAVQPDAISDAVLRLILFEDAIDAALANAGAGLFLLPETASAKPGFAMLPFAAGNLTQDFPLSDELSIGVRGNVDLAGGAGVLVRPGRDVEFLLGLASGTPAPASGTFALALRYASADGRFIPIGSVDGSRFELAALSTTVGTRLSSSGVDAFVEFALEQSKVVIKPDSETLDGFLANVLPAKGVEFDTSVTVGLSSNRGVYFTGTGGDSLQSALDSKADLDATLPVNIPAGPATLRAVHLRLAAGNAGLKTEVSASVQITFGPVTAVIERLGLLLDVDFPRGGASPAPLDARGGFKAPSGVGLSVDVTGVVSGGGFLFHDPAQGLYAGAMQLSLRAITLKAFGLISTRMPDGSRGYSLIVFITAEDFRPIPLGLGFTLLGVGGIVGVNRTFDERVLRAGLSSGMLATLLFPRDPIGNAGTLIRNLSSAFPPLRGSYLLGLMAKIGWFTPTLVLMDLALILEFGARTRLLALGRISALLPSPDNDLVRLQMEAIGVIDFDAGTAAIDAELVDSRLAKKFPITGKAALRAGFGEGPGFVLAVGGFNPHFAAPTTVPTLTRVAIALSSGTNPRLVCEAYFAITSNTVQFGAHASLYASAAGFSVEGDIGYDVLVQLAPLHFLAEFHAKLQLKRGSHNLFGVQVNGAIEGPRPLRVSGKAKFEIFWCDFTVRFDATLVKGERPPLPAAVNVFEQLKQALSSATSWSTQRSATETHGVALRSLAPATATAPIVLDPLGRLVVKQQVVPLNTGSDIEIFGSAPVSGDRRFRLTATLNGTQLPSTPVQASFAPAQFFVMSDDEKLAAPSFQSMEAGSMFGEAGVTFDATQVIPAPLEYQVISITLDGPAPPTETTPQPPAFAMEAEQLQVFARSGAAARAPVRRVGRARFRNEDAEAAATLAPNRWTIQPIGEGPAPTVGARVKTYVEYQAVVNVMNRGGARWQVVPAREVETRNSDAG